MKSYDFELITVGGGLGGSALAKKMAENGARVLVVERERHFSDRIRGEWVASRGSESLVKERRRADGELGGLRWIHRRHSSPFAGASEGTAPSSLTLFDKKGQGLSGERHGDQNPCVAPFPSTVDRV